MGVVSASIIAIFTDFITSQKYFPIRWLAQFCRSSPAATVTLGLALGYMSTFIPIILVMLVAYHSNMLLGFYGVALAAIGMLSSLPISLSLSALDSISRNSA